MTALKKTPRHNWRPFEEARAFVRSLGLKGQAAWIAWAKSDARPDDMPADPREIYKDDGWTRMGDWLGTRNRKGGYRPFQEARAFVRSLGLKDIKAWRSWAKSNERPDDIPTDAYSVYADQGWEGWGDWLGAGSIASFNRIYRPFEEARIFARNLGLKNKAEWANWTKSDDRPDDIPANPQTVFNDQGWVSWGDWLKTQNRKGGYRPFQEARTFVRGLGLTNRSDWWKWSKGEIRPNDIPANPEEVYRNRGWQGWGDWLGTERIATKCQGPTHR